MNPTDIDQIANAVVGTLANADPGLLGCGAVSSSTEYIVSDSEAAFYCRFDYYCGGAAAFACNASVQFGCGDSPGRGETFECSAGPGGGFTCGANTEFGCWDVFSGGA